MSERLHCDQCGLSVENGTALDWLMIEKANPVLSGLADMRLALHFCSWNCLAQYAKEEAA